MTMLFKLIIKSLLNRSLSSALLIILICLSSLLLLSIEKISSSAKTSFHQSISGTDLIVGARSGDLQLLMYSVFRQGDATVNMTWESAQRISKLKAVKWMIPISLGDSHKGYSVLGTNLDYFKYYQFKNKESININQGRLFNSPLDVVIGSRVAKKLGYSLGDQIYLSHGLSNRYGSIHDTHSFKIVGILDQSGTVIDQTIYVGLDGLELIHQTDPSESLETSQITACLIGLHSKISLFMTQRQITNWNDEPLMAIIPGVTLSKFWKNFRHIDTAFRLITVIVIIISMIGLLSSLVISMQQRKRELAILRSLGANPLQISSLVLIESFILTGIGVGIGLLTTIGLGGLFQTFIESRTGLWINIQSISFKDILMITALIMFNGFVSLIPAILAYKNSLIEGFEST